MIRIFPLILLAVLLGAGCAHRPPPAIPQNAVALTDAIGDRLAFAREVAWIKYRDGLPVRDPAREEAVLDEVTHRAEHSGLEPRRVRAIFAAQIRASCLEQARWLRLWRHGDPLPVYAPRALNGGVRDDIDAANLRLLAALAA